jgi:hypothetical protein
MSTTFLIKVTARTAARWNQHALVTTRARVAVVVSRYKAAAVARDRAVASAMAVSDVIAAMTGVRTDRSSLFHRLMTKANRYPG